MKWSVKKTLLLLILIFLITKLTELMWNSPFYNTPQDKFLNVLKGYGIGLAVFGLPYIYINRTGQINRPEKKMDEDVDEEFSRILKNIYSEDPLLHPDALNSLNRMSKEREVILQDYSRAVVDYYIANRQYGKYWTPKDHVLGEFIKNRYPGLYPEDIAKLILIVKYALQNHELD